MELRKIKKAFTGYLPLVVKSGLASLSPVFYAPMRFRPTSATVMITDRCNLKCVMCRQWQDNHPKELSREAWERILRDLRTCGINNIHFTGGEPLLSKDLSYLMKFAAKNSFTIGMTTNGTLLDGAKLDELVFSGLRSVALSVDAVGEKYEAIRGVKGAFNKMDAAAKAVSDRVRHNGLHAYINFTLLKDNISDLSEVKKYADSLGLPLAVNLLDPNSSIFDTDKNKTELWIKNENDMNELKKAVSFLKKVKGRRPSSLIINYPAIDFIPQYFKDPVSKHIPCVSSQDRLIIDPYGNLLGGCMSMGTFGNLSETPLKVILAGERYRKAMKNMFYKKCRGCSCGYFINIKTLPKYMLNDMWQRFVFNVLKVKA